MNKAYFLIQYNKCFGDVDDPGYRVVNKESILPGVDPLTVEIGQVVTFFGFDNHPFITAKVLKTSDREVELHKALTQIILKNEGKKRRRPANKNLGKGKENVDTDILQMVLDIDEAMKTMQETTEALQKTMKTFQETHDLVKRKTGRIKFLHNQQNKLSNDIVGNGTCKKYPTITGLPPGFEIVYRGTNDSNPQNSKKRKLDDCEDELDCSIDPDNESETDSAQGQITDELAEEDQDESASVEKIATESVETVDKIPDVADNSMGEKILENENSPDIIYQKTIPAITDELPEIEVKATRRKRISAEQMVIDDNEFKNKDEYNLAYKREPRKICSFVENKSPDALKKPRKVTGIIKKRSLNSTINGETEVSLTTEKEKKVTFMLDSESSGAESPKPQRNKSAKTTKNARKSLYRKITKSNSLNSENDEFGNEECNSNCEIQETSLLTNVRGRKILRRDSGLASDSVEIIFQETGDEKKKDDSCESTPLNSSIEEISSTSSPVANSKETEKDGGSDGNKKIMLEDSVEHVLLQFESSNDFENENNDKDFSLVSKSENMNLDKTDEQKDSTPRAREETSFLLEFSNIDNSTVENNITNTNVGNSNESMLLTSNDDSIVQQSYIDENVPTTNDNDTSLSDADKNLDSSKPDIEENYVKPTDLLPKEILTLPNATEILSDKSSYVKIKPSDLSDQTYENKDTYSWTLKFPGPIEGTTIQILNGLNVYLAKESLLIAATARDLDDLCKILLESIFNMDALKECGLLRHKSQGIKYRLHPRALNSIIIFAKLVAKIKQWNVDLSDKAITNSIRSKLKQIQQT